MTCKVQLYFVDTASSSEVESSVSLYINGVAANGITTQTDSTLVFTYGTPLPGDGGYFFSQWRYSLNGGSSFSTSSSSTLTVTPPNNGYVVVQCMLRGNYFRMSYVYNNGSGTTRNVDYRYNESTTLLSAPTAPSSDKTFKGWSIDGTMYAAGATYKMPNYAQTATGTWIDTPSTTHTITYYSNNPSHSVYRTDSKSEGICFQLTTAPSYTGYQFTGWLIGGTTYAAGAQYEMPSSDVTAEAQWSAKAEIHYNYQNPSTTDYIDYCVPDETVNLRSAPTYDGYAFVGWQIDGVTYGATASFTMPSSGNVYATALWVAKYTLHYIYNNPEATDVPVTVQGGMTITLASKPTYDYHTFLGWKIGDVVYAASASYTMPESDVTADAQWEKTEYTLSFSGLSGWEPSSIESITATYDEDITLPSTVPTRTNYRFVSWYIGSSYYRPSEVLRITQNRTASLTASNTTEVTVTFGANSGTFPSGAETSRVVEVLGTYGVKSGESVTTPFPTVTRTGYQFLGWYDTSSSSGGKQITVSSVVCRPSNHTIYARWLQQCRIRFYKRDGTWTDGSTGDKDLYFDVGHVMSASDFPGISKTGYTSEDFLGWWTSESGGTKIDAGYEIPSSSSIYLYPRWVEKTTFRFYARPSGSCVFDDYSGVTYVDIPYTAGTTFGSMPTVSRTDSGYEGTFDGWFTNESSLSGVKYDASSTVPSSALSFYSRWSIPYVFNANGGTFEDDTSSKTQYYFYGSVTGSSPYRTFGSFPSNPTRTGYSFLGWFTGSTGGTQIQTTDAVPYYYTATYYAHWEEVATEVTITFTPDGGVFPTGTQTEFTVSVGDTFTTPIAPTWEGATGEMHHEFEYYSNGDFNSLASVSVSVDSEKFTSFLESPTFASQWNSYWEYKYLTYAGELYDTQQYASGDIFYGPITHPYRAGYEADGFTPDIPATGTVVTSNETFTFKYKNVEPYSVTFFNYDGEILQTNDYNDGDIVTPPQNPSRTGYTFAGWSPSNYSPASQDVREVYATYTGNVITLTFNPNGGTWWDESQGTKTVEYTVGTAVTTPGSVSKSGAVFVGWSPTISVMPLEATTYLAQWVDSSGAERFGSTGTDYVFVQPPSDYVENSILGDPMPIRDLRGGLDGRILRWEDPIYMCEWVGELAYWMENYTSKPSPSNTEFADDRQIVISRLLGSVGTSVSSTFGKYLHASSSSSIMSKLFDSINFPYMWGTAYAKKQRIQYKIDKANVITEIEEIESSKASNVSSFSIGMYGAGMTGGLDATVVVADDDPCDYMLLSSDPGERFYENCMTTGDEPLSSGTPLKKAIPESMYNVLLDSSPCLIFPRQDGYVGFVRWSGDEYEWDSSVTRTYVAEGPSGEDIRIKKSGYSADFAPGTDIYDHSVTPQLVKTRIEGRAATHSPSNEYTGNEPLTPTQTLINESKTTPETSLVLFKSTFNENGSVGWDSVSEAQSFSPVWVTYDTPEHWGIHTDSTEYISYLSSGQNFSTEGLRRKISSFSFVCDISPFLRNHTKDGSANAKGVFVKPLKFFFLIEVDCGQKFKSRDVNNGAYSYPTISLTEYSTTKSAQKSYFFVPWDATYDGIVDDTESTCGYQTLWKVNDVENLLKAVLEKSDLYLDYKQYYDKYATKIGGCNQPSIGWVSEGSTATYIANSRIGCYGSCRSNFYGKLTVTIKKIGCASSWTPWPSIGLTPYE